MRFQVFYLFLVEMFAENEFFGSAGHEAADALALADALSYVGATHVDERRIDQGDSRGQG